VIKSDEQQGKKGPDGKWHDAFLPANFTALAGVPVRVTVFNYDDMPHSFTSSALHVNKVIPSAKGEKPSKTTFVFTPKKAGKFLWWCAVPCDPWAMGHAGYMRGYVKVVA
jgi:heme/copper-type cytochrome/quinol oxidase subunit 2